MANQLTHLSLLHTISLCHAMPPFFPCVLLRAPRWAIKCSAEVSNLQSRKKMLLLCLLVSEKKSMITALMRQTHFEELS